MLLIILSSIYFIYLESNYTSEGRDHWLSMWTGHFFCWAATNNSWKAGLTAKLRENQDLLDNFAEIFYQLSADNWRKRMN